jgi:hypothetical protein
VLPVELTSLSANLKDNAVEIRWATATESNNYAFDIERSASASLWTKVGSVKGSGNSNTPKNYSFVDKTTLQNGKYYYRLKQIDATGDYKYSEAVAVDLKLTPKTFTLDQNYPNPFNPSTSIRFGLPVDSHVQIRVYNTIGQQVALLTNDVMTAGYQTVNWNAASLSSGLYYYSVEAKSLDGKSTFSATKKMMLLK